MAKRKLRKLGPFSRLLPLIVVSIVVLAALLGLGLGKTGTASSLQTYADQIVKSCSSQSYRATCYEQTVPKLMDKISMEDAFKVTALIQNEDSSYQYCHVLGHELSAREVDKDPSKWKEVVSRCPSGMCSNGCIHGGFQERFRSESLTDQQIANVRPDLEMICEDRPSWHPTGLEQSSCYHALGHLTMYMTTADTSKSIGLCREIASKSDGRDYTQVCFDGVFMQIFQPLEPEDFALVKGKRPDKNNLFSFCDAYSGEQRGSCLSEGWPLYRDEITTPAGMVSYCAHEDGAAQTDRCFNALEFVVTAQLNLNETNVTSFCSGLPQSRSGICFANAASRFIEVDYRNIDRAVSLCRTSQTKGFGNDCYQQMVMYSTFNFSRGSVSAKDLCNKLPDPWRQECLSKIGGKP